MDNHCQCACCNRGELDDLRVPCLAPITQEDLLCDYCRAAKSDPELTHCHLFGSSAHGHGRVPFPGKRFNV